MNQVVLIVLIVLVLWVATVVGTVALATMLLRKLVMLLRSAGRARARELSERARMRIGAQGTGMPAQAARLRYELRDAVADTKRTVAAAASAGWPVGDSPSLVRRLERAAADLDAQLRLLALDRRPGTSTQPLDGLRERTGTVVAACTDLRSSLRQQAVSVGDEELRQLREDCRIESEALRPRPADLTP